MKALVCVLLICILLFSFIGAIAEIPQNNEQKVEQLVEN
jgi:hypothetical protein